MTEYENPWQTGENMHSLLGYEAAIDDARKNLRNVQSGIKYGKEFWTKVIEFIQKAEDRRNNNNA
jgi:hypothetical protein